MEDDRIEAIEADLLLEAIFRRYGHDFRHYSRAHLMRRLKYFLAKSGGSSISELIAGVMHDEAFFERLIFEFSITVTKMFRDPPFFRCLRENVLPVLRTYPFIRAWVAGCATGEEAYSLAIILKEEGLYKNSTIFATDFNDFALNKAKEGTFSLDKIREFTGSYQLSGGVRSFADYYHADSDFAMIDPSLKENIVFANHNLSTDSVFGEMHLVLCRNVLIYFERKLQERVLSLFGESLIRGGFLCLGSREDIRFLNAGGLFTSSGCGERIFRKAS